mgnify:CR=1 FL=1
MPGRIRGSRFLRLYSFFYYLYIKNALLSNFQLDNKGGIFRGTTLYYYTCHQIQSLNTV